MAHYHRIPDLLDALVTSPSIAAASRHVGMTPQTCFNYLIRSRNGDEPFQNIEWQTIVAPFHIHFANAAKLNATIIEANARERATNGCWVPSFYQGAPVFEENDTFIGWPDSEMEALGFNPARDRWKWETGPDGKQRRVQVRVWLKPSEQLTLKMLESHFAKQYGSHHTLDVNYGGVLRLERPDERAAPKPKAIEHFDDDNDVEQRGGHLALGRPAKDSAEMDKWNAAGEFKPQPVAFVDAEGNRTERIAAPDPLLPKPGDSESVRSTKEKARASAKNPFPLDKSSVRDRAADNDMPDDAGSRKPTPTPPPDVRQQSTAGDGRERIGYGKVPPGGYRLA